MRAPPPRPSTQTAGFAPATGSRCSTTAACVSATAPRTCSRSAARTSPRARSSASCCRSPACTSARSSPGSMRCSTRCRCCSCCPPRTQRPTCSTASAPPARRRLPTSSSRTSCGWSTTSRARRWRRSPRPNCAAGSRPKPHRRRPVPEAAASPPPPREALPWAMLFRSTAAFTMSQAFRTVGAILAAPLQAEFGLSPQQLGTFAGAFHFAFGALQLAMGVGIDLHGVRRTVLTAFPLAIAGALLSALAPGYAVLVLGQVLIGIGCAPAFLVCTVFIARHFPPERFAAVSGLILSVGGIGLLVTGTPLAWLVEATSWRMGFFVLAGCSVAAWGLIAWQVHEPPLPRAPDAPRESIAQAVLAFAALLRLPWTVGIVGLSLGPLLIERHGFSLVASGNVALAVSAISLCGPALFGRFDPGGDARRRWLVGWSFALAAMFVALALLRSAAIDVATLLAIGLVSGYMVLQYSEVRAAYPAAIVGRALALFTMAMVMGVALMQWFTGFVASQAMAGGADPNTVVMLTIAALLVAGALAFAL